MKKIITTLSIALLFVGFVYTDLIAAELSKKLKMTVIVKSMENPFWDRTIAGAKEAGKDLNIEIEALAPIKPYNVEEQLRFMDNAITKRHDAIAIAPGDSLGIIPGIEKASKAGLVVTTLSSDAFGGPVTAYSGSPNFESAYEVGKYLCAQLKEGSKVIILEGTAGNEVAIERKRGFDKAITDSQKKIQVLTSQTAKFSRVEGQRVMENLLQRFPEIDAAFCANDEMALGAVEAIDAAGRLAKIKVCGYDGNDDAKASIRKGRMLVTADQRPDAQGYWGVVAAYIAIKGMPVPRKLYIPCPLVTKETLPK